MNQLKNIISFAAGIMGFMCIVATVIYVLRLPIYNDIYTTWISNTIKYALILIVISTALTAVIVALMWACKKSVVFQYVMAALILLTFVGSLFKDNRCVETRFTTCNEWNFLRGSLARLRKITTTHGQSGRQSYCHGWRATVTSGDLWWITPLST